MLSELFYTMNFSFSILISTINLLVCFPTIVMVIKIRRFRTLNNILLCNTCVAAIFYSIVIIVASIYGFREDWAFSAPLCSFRAYFFNVGVALICHSKSLHAISRFFFAVLYKQRYLLTWRFHWILICLNWIIGLTVCIPPFFVNDGYTLENESRLCVISSKSYLMALYISFVSCIIPFNIIIGVYINILIYVRRSSRRVWALNQNNLHKTKREMKLMKQMVIQTGVLISGGPIFLFLIAWHATQTQPPPESLYLIGFTLMIFVGSITPMVQLIMNKQLNQFVIQTFKRHQLAFINTKSLHQQQQAWHVNQHVR